MEKLDGLENCTLYYFTFGANQRFAGYCQPIRAKGYGEARAKMFELYGEKWCFQYTSKVWEELKNDPKRMYPMERELEVIECEETL